MTSKRAIDMRIYMLRKEETRIRAEIQRLIQARGISALRVPRGSRKSVDVGGWNAEIGPRQNASYPSFGRVHGPGRVRVDSVAA